jgi:hypothetical protein
LSPTDAHDDEVDVRCFGILGAKMEVGGGLGGGGGDGAGGGGGGNGGLGGDGGGGGGGLPVHIITGVGAEPDPAALKLKPPCSSPCLPRVIT